MPREKIQIVLDVDGAARARRELGTIDNSVAVLKRSFLGLAGTIGVGLGLANLGRSVIDTARTVESLQRSMEFATGSAESAKTALEDVAELADELGANAIEAQQGFVKIAAAAKGTALEGKEVEEIFRGVIQASTALQLSSDQTSGALRALEQIISKGTVQAEELRGQLGERIPGAFQIAARAMGVTTRELGKMLEQGEVVSDEFLPRFARELQRTFGDAATRSADTLNAQINRLDNAWDELLITIGETGIIDAAAFTFEQLAEVLAVLGEEIKNTREQFDALINLDLREIANNSMFGLASRSFGFGEIFENGEGEEERPERPQRNNTLPQLDTGGTEEQAKKLKKTFEDVFGEIRIGNRELRAQLQGWSDIEEQMREVEKVSRTLGRQLTDEEAEAVREVVRARQELKGAIEAQTEAQRENEDALREQKRLTDELGFSFESAFEDAILAGEGLREVLQGLAQDILKIALRRSVTQPLGDVLGGGLSSLISGFFASGTNYAPGGLSVVGEQGPELVNLPRGSQVIPNHKLGGGDVIINTTVDARGADEGVEQRITAALRERDRQLPSLIRGVVSDSARRGQIALA